MYFLMLLLKSSIYFHIINSLKESVITVTVYNYVIAFRWNTKQKILIRNFFFFAVRKFSISPLGHHWMGKSVFSRPSLQPFIVFLADSPPTLPFLGSILPTHLHKAQMNEMNWHIVFGVKVTIQFYQQNFTQL